MDNHNTGLVRPLPRWSEATQRRSLAEAGIERAIVLGDRDDAASIADIRSGDAVHVYLLHLLAERNIVGIHARTSLFWWLRHLVARGAVIVETGTSRRVDAADLADIPTLLDMAAEAIETITRGTRGRAAVQRARDAGVRGGRKPFDPTRNRDAVEALHYAPPDKRLTGSAYIKALRRLGWSRAKAYEHLQGRDGRLE